VKYKNPLFQRARSARLNMMSKRQRRDLVVGTVLTVVVVVFIICHSLKCVINIIELAVVLFGEEI
jgi:hypothetical protein